MSKKSAIKWVQQYTLECCHNLLFLSQNIKNYNQRSLQRTLKLFTSKCKNSSCGVLANSSQRYLVNYVFKFCFSMLILRNGIFFVINGARNDHSSSQFVNTLENNNAYEDLSSFDQASKCDFIILKDTY